MAIGSKDQPWAAAARIRTTARNGPSRSLVVGGLVLVAALVALLTFGRTGPADRDVGSTASTRITTSPPTDHTSVTEPARPTPLPPR